MSKGTILYAGNFELPDKGASANRVMTNRLLFADIGYRTAYLGIVRGAHFEGVRKSDFDDDVYERAYPSSIITWLKNTFSLDDIIEVSQRYGDLKAVVLYNTPFALVKKAKKHFAKLNVKVLYDCTEWCFEEQSSKLKRMYKRYDVDRLRNDLEKYVDGLILVSSLMYEHYKNVPAVLLPPLVNIDAPLWHTKNQRSDDNFEFCYAGDPGTKDNMCRLIEAFKAFKNNKTTLRIIGMSKTDFLDQNPEYEVILDCLADRVRFMGRLSHEDTVKYLLGADCFIFVRESRLRNNAGFPTKFVEAYTSGVQVISTGISDIKKYEASSIHILEDTSVTSIGDMMDCAAKKKLPARLRDDFDYRKFIGVTENFLHHVIK